MRLTLIRRQLDGELVLVVTQHQFLTNVKRLLQDHMAVVFLADLHLLTEQLQTTEDRTLLVGAAGYQFRVDDVQAVIAADEHLAVMGHTHRTLVVRTLLQTVLRTKAMHEERPGAVFLLLWRDIRNTMFGDDPHRMTMILNDAHDTGAKQTAVHVEQFLPAADRVIDAAARHRPLPDESATVFHHTDGSGSGLRLTCHDRNLHVGHLTAHGVDQRVIGGVSGYQPALLDPTHRRHEVLVQVRVIRTPDTELTRLAVESLHTVTQRTDPDVAPLVLGHRPDVIIQQTVIGTRHQIVLDTAIGINLYQTAVIGTKPERTVVRAITRHHHVRSKAARLVDQFSRLGFGIKFDDTAVVGTQPVHAVLTFHRGVDITEFDGPDTRGTLDILVQTVTIGTDPHVTRLVEHQSLRRILTERGLVELVVQELLDLLVVEIHDDEPLMVGGKPHPVALVHDHIPHLQILRQTRNTVCG